MTHVPVDSPSAHRIAFDGLQPESCELLLQTVRGLDPGLRYQLQWEARAQGISSPSGLEWKLPGSSGAVDPSADWTASETTFTAPAQAADLRLRYQRPIGEPRSEGWVELRRVRITPVR